jgi:hypothetical protein
VVVVEVEMGDFVLVEVGGYTWASVRMASMS